MTRNEALKLLDKWVPNKNLQKHMFAVESAMRAYAKKFGEDVEIWASAGLLHDADWERWPDKHPLKIVNELKSLGVDESVIDAIANHGGKGAEDLGVGLPEHIGFVLAAMLQNRDRLGL